MKIVNVFVLLLDYENYDKAEEYMKYADLHAIY